MGFQKPNDIRYRKLMESNDQILLQDERSEEVASLVQLQRLAERVAESHSAIEPAGDPQMEAITAEVNAQMFQNELDQWRGSTPDVIRNLRTLNIEIHTPLLGLRLRITGVIAHEADMRYSDYWTHRA